MASSDLEFLAQLAFSVLEVDASANPLLYAMYPRDSTINEALSYFHFNFAPSLVGILQAPQPPSV